MTISHLTKSLVTTSLIAAGAFSVLAVAPSAMAAPSSTTTTLSTGVSLAPLTVNTTNVEKVADQKRDRRNAGRGDRVRDNRHRDRNRNRNARRNDNRHHSHNRNTRRQYNRGYNRGYRQAQRHNYRHNRVHRPVRARHYTPYRSGLGISLNFGTSGHNRHRWARSPYSFYNTSYGSYNGYQAATVCRRVNRVAYHHGHQELISVKECSNPWSGTYVVQGSERIIDCRY